jgi:hypothetical protein
MLESETFEGGLPVDRPKDDLAVRRARTAAARAATASGCPKRQRSALTNGKLLTGVDGRNPWLRRAKDLIREHVVDLGGPDNVSVAERSIIRRAAVITAELEHLEARFALAGEATAEDLDLYLRGSNNLRRLLEAIGLRRRPRDITPDPLAYARELDTDEGAL